MMLKDAGKVAMKDFYYILPRSVAKPFPSSVSRTSQMTTWLNPSDDRDGIGQMEVYVAGGTVFAGGLLLRVESEVKVEINSANHARRDGTSATSNS